MNFVKLTKKDGEIIFINISEIRSFYWNDYLTIIYYNNGFEKVKETADEVMNKINALL